MQTILLMPLASGDWDVCQEGTALFNDLPLGQAVWLARVVAGDEHQRRHGPTCVAMPGTRGQVVPARHAQLDPDRAARGVAA